MVINPQAHFKLQWWH